MVELIVYGIVLGSIISLGAIGLTLIYGIIRFANFAHGDLMSVGAYVALFMVTGVLSWVGIPDSTFGPFSFGGLIIGVAQQVSTAFLLPTYKPAVAFIIMILILLIRPKGIFGGSGR